MIDFTNLSQSDLIELFGIACSLFVGVVSLIIALATLQQNSKMIKDSTRPYIVIYPKVTYIQTTDFFVVIKNMGQSGATIKNIKCDVDLSKFVYLRSINPFDKIANTFFAPGQSIHFEIDPVKLKTHNLEQINFEIEYFNKRKKYKENFSINYGFEKSIVHSRINTENKELRGIYFAMQEMVEQNL